MENKYQKKPLWVDPLVHKKLKHRAVENETSIGKEAEKILIKELSSSESDD